MRIIEQCRPAIAVRKKESHCLIITHLCIFLAVRHFKISVLFLLQSSQPLPPLSPPPLPPANLIIITPCNNLLNIRPQQNRMLKLCRIAPLDIH